MSETRKIAAILVADIVGFSRLAGADEDRILARLRALRSDLIDPAIARPSWAHRQAHRRRQPHRVPQRGRRGARNAGVPPGGFRTPWAGRPGEGWRSPCVGRVDQIAPQRPQARQRAILVGSREPAVADDVGDQDRRNFRVSLTARLKSVSIGRVSAAASLSHEGAAERKTRRYADESRARY
jgi:hypothetical protein